MTNDLFTRAHVADMLIAADDIQEYHEYLDTCCHPDIVDIEEQIADDIRRKCQIAESLGMSVDDYIENLADRRDSLLLDLQYARMNATK